jgi:transcription antitermination factor NusG
MSLVSYQDVASLTAPWFVAKVRPNCEKKAAASLQARDVRVLIPEYERQTKRTPTKPAKIPLFPGYVFYQLLNRSLISVLSAPGVIHILTSNGVPEPVDGSEMRSIFQLLASGVPVEPWKSYVRGQRVRIVSGSLEGTEGVVVRDNGKARLVISISILQRSVSAEIERVHLEAVSVSTCQLCSTGINCFSHSSDCLPRSIC